MWKLALGVLVGLLMFSGGCIICFSLATTNTDNIRPAGYTGDDVRYEITGTAQFVDVTLHNSAGGTEQYSNIAVPFYFSFNKFNDRFLYISAQNKGSTGSVVVSIYLYGKLIKQSSSNGAYVIASASASK